MKAYKYEYLILYVLIRYACVFMYVYVCVCIKHLVNSLEQNICCYKTSFHETTAGCHQVWGQNKIVISFLPQALMKSSCGFMKASLKTTNVLFQRIYQLLKDTIGWEIYTNVYVCLHVNMYIYIETDMHHCMYECMHKHVLYASRYLCMSEDWWMCVYICMYVWACMNVWIYVCVEILETRK